MEICLGINEDIQQTFQRYEFFKKKIKPAEFNSVFMNDYIRLNMYMSETKNQNQGKQSSSHNNMQLLNQNVSNQDTQNQPQQQGQNYIKDLNDLFS